MVQPIMFKLSRRADYAIRVMLELCVAGGERLTAQQAAKRGSIPFPFLGKILADLVDAGLVVTHAGPRGGLNLAKPAHSVTILDVVEAVEGRMCLNTCLVRPGECPRDRICPAHGFWGRLQALVMAEMRQANLAGLAAEYRALRQSPRPHGQIFALYRLISSPPRASVKTGDEFPIPKGSRSKTWRNNEPK